MPGPMKGGAGEDSWESLGPQGDQTSQSNQPWILIGRTDAKAETSILWPPDVKSWLIGKDSDAGKDWRQKKGKREYEMVGRHHRFNGYELGQTPGDGDRQGGLVCCSLWGCKEQYRTWQLKTTVKGERKWSMSLPSGSCKILPLGPTIILPPALRPAYPTRGCSLSLTGWRRPWSRALADLQPTCPGNQDTVCYCSTNQLRLTDTQDLQPTCVC